MLIGWNLEVVREFTVRAKYREHTDGHGGNFVEGEVSPLDEVVADAR